LTVNGKSLDLNSGRVVLVDLSGKEVRWKQAVVPLPVSTSQPVEVKEIESAARKTLDHVRRESAIVRDFLK
jgi:hypothetical protein